MLDNRLALVAVIAAVSIVAVFVVILFVPDLSQIQPPGGDGNNNTTSRGILTVLVKYEDTGQPIANVPVKLMGTIDNYKSSDISTVNTDSSGVARFDLTNSQQWCDSRTAARIFIIQTANYKGFEQDIPKPLCQTRTITATVSSQPPPAPKPIIAGQTVSVTTQNWQGHINGGLATNINVDFQQPMSSITIYSKILRTDGTVFASTGSMGRSLVSSVSYANNWYILEDVSSFTPGPYIFQLYVDTPYYTYTLSIPITVTAGSYFTLSNFNNSSGTENIVYKPVPALEIIKMQLLSLFSGQGQDTQGHNIQYQGQMVLVDN